QAEDAIRVFHVTGVQTCALPISKLVLIEGSDDADQLIPHIVSHKSKLPIAILAYTADAPVRTFVYPLANYSPEYQALVWCHENRSEERRVRQERQCLWPPKHTK